MSNMKNEIAAAREELQAEYQSVTPDLTRLQGAMVEQLGRLVTNSELTLGVPIESRIKSWISVAEKAERKSLVAKSLSDFDDLLGLRVIFLFERDIEVFQRAIEHTFVIVSSEDASQRLAETQFGYSSRHYVITIPKEWERTPSFLGLTDQKIEVQVRTLAQHIWAAASHKLQYKREESVPPPLRRSIHRVSALLEIVDQEFARLLVERDGYVKTMVREATSSATLNVSLLETVLDETLPASNKDAVTEDYSDLLEDLRHFNVLTVGDLRALIQEYLPAIMRADTIRVAEEGEFSWDAQEIGESNSDRLNRGVFFTHSGLTRQALAEKFGEDAMMARPAPGVGPF